MNIARMRSATFLNTAGAIFWVGSAGAGPLPAAYPSNSAALFASAMQDEAQAEEFAVVAGLAPDLRRQVVNYPIPAAAGTVIIDTMQTYLYFVLGGGKAIRYGIGVGRDGFTWSGSQSVTRMAKWPDWTPPEQMITRQPYLPRWMAGGQGNPLGARAIYLGNTMYRIHGTNAPATIGTRVSSGCIRLINADVIDLYNRVNLGTKIIVLPDRSQVTRAVAPVSVRPVHVTALRIGDLRASGIY
jgi:lipoprotein-anchoring transpeptidase ErfK/SrfK